MNNDEMQSPTSQQLNLPKDIREPLECLCRDLAAAAGANLTGIVLYGGVARGRYRAGKSDINLVILLNDASPKTLRTIAPLLQSARRSILVEPLILEGSEVPSVGRVFPTKFLEIQKHHIVLVGDDPFVQLQVSPEEVKARIEQSLCNLLLRLRRQYITYQEEPMSVERLLRDLAVPMKVELEALLRLVEKDDPSLNTTGEVLDLAATVFGLDAGALGQIADLRHQSASEDVHELFERVVATLVLAIEKVRSMR